VGIFLSILIYFFGIHGTINEFIFEDMTKKNITTIILAFVSVGIIIFIAADLWSSINSFRERPNRNFVQNKIQVATSFYPIYFFAQQIGGDKANILDITPVGLSPHDYQPTSQEMTTIENSNLVILNGLGLEPWSDSAQNITEKKNIIVIFASGNLSESQVLESEKDKVDPHIWLSPAMAKQMTDKILEGFLQADSKNADYYKANANKLKLELDKLATKYKNGLVNCQDKNIVTSHGAFAYLAKDYGLNQILIVGLSSSAEPSSQQLTNIAEFVKKESVKYIFVENSDNLGIANNMAAKAGVKILVLNPIESLTQGQLKTGKNYFTEMDSNLANLKTALQCQ